MTKSELIEKVTNETPTLLKKQVEMIVNSMFNSMIESLANGEKIEIRGFGNFKVKIRNAKTARNPKTGQKVQISSKGKVHFKIGKPFHYALNK